MENIKNNSKILVISQSINQPRVVNRINYLAGIYDTVVVYTFRRKVYSVDNYKRILSDRIQINIIGEFEDGVYLKRLNLYFKLILLLLANLFKKNDIYSFGLDCGFISLIFFNKKKYYEVSDIKWLYEKGFFRFILRTIDYIICFFSSKIYFTSEGFYRYYYAFLSRKKISVIENKFNTYGFVKPVLKIYDEKVSIAIIGSLRYENIMEKVLKIICKRNHIVLNIYGDGSSNIKSLLLNYTSKYNNINYHGIFKNPNDLESIYSNNNINFVCYDNELENEKVALPNKYYESGFFNIPLVCASNTYLSELVEQNKMGWSIDTDFNSLEFFFDTISIDNIIKIHNHIKMLDKNQFVKCKP